MHIKQKSQKMVCMQPTVKKTYDYIPELQRRIVKRSHKWSWDALSQESRPLEVWFCAIHTFTKHIGTDADTEHVHKSYCLLWHYTGCVKIISNLCFGFLYNVTNTAWTTFYQSTIVYFILCYTSKIAQTKYWNFTMTIYNNLKCIAAL